SIFSILNKPISKRISQSEEMRFSKEIELKDVFFKFSERSNASIDGVSMKIKKGEMVAVVGESGSGKSTLANMLMGLLSPQMGKILIDDKEMGEISFDSWADQITWVSQNPILKAGTLAENMQLAKYDASEKEIAISLEDAMILDEINDLPAGVKTKIGEKGFRLSAGQKQRIALARAFLRNTEVMIFDEPTANLDVKTENSLQKTFLELKGKKTLIIISHRLNTIKQADKIILLDKGKILEIGSHQELLKRKGKYFEMVTSYVGVEI
ncbi:MAG: ABC transporter ATP-binding protein, partial [Candidatus Heimdallarchaeota archaeon]|nr:ABC transporter ATP-binding protein [Candidatus Heimdallarchaeota archaeon]